MLPFLKNSTGIYLPYGVNSYYGVLFEHGTDISLHSTQETEFLCPYSNIFSNQWGLSKFNAILITKNLGSSDPDPKLIITDPDPANNFGSGWMDASCCFKR